MARHQHTHSLLLLEEALSVLFCLIDDTYAHLNPRAAHSYESIKRLSDSEVIALALFQRAARRGERTLFLAGCQAVLLSPLSGGGKASPLEWSRCGGRSSPSSSASQRRCS
jgi:hypothetical protein